MADKYIITKQEIEEFGGSERTHFLNEGARRLNKSLGDLTGLNGFGFHIIELRPGRSSAEYHVHHFEDECIYILEGEAEAVIGEETFTVAAGDFVGYRAGGEAHSLTNSGSGLLKCIVVGSRLQHDVCDYPKIGKRLYSNGDMKSSLVDMDDIKTPDFG
ncbi:MAG: cupin [Kordiimonadales bacterium]|nr:MAG: cupin [Kordiimonadales bacterium]